MRLLQLTSQPGSELPPCPGPPRHCIADDTPRTVEHIYESPDSLRRMPAGPRTDWRSGNVSRNDEAWNQQAAVEVGRRYEMPVSSHDQQRFTGSALSTIGNYSL